VLILIAFDQYLILKVITHSFKCLKDKIPKMATKEPETQQQASVVLKNPAPPEKLLIRPKTILRGLADFLFFPARVLLPDPVTEKLGLSSLRTERMGIMLQMIQGRCLDIGAQDNLLMSLYKKSSSDPEAMESVGVDVIDWGGDCMVLPNSAVLPFDDKSFNTVTLVACLNHIPERRETLHEAQRILKPGGLLLVTMISRFVGYLDHRLRWWGEHSERDVHQDELDGMNREEVLELIIEAGFQMERQVPFFYGLNTLYIARKV
jgi:SAM-dependent methyltransferase